MKYECGSAIIGKQRQILNRLRSHLPFKHKRLPCFVRLCKKNNPHLTAEIPFKFLDYDVHKITFKDLELNYLVQGSDIVLNDLKSLDIEVEGDHLNITGLQKSKRKSE